MQATIGGTSKLPMCLLMSASAILPVQKWGLPWWVTWLNTYDRIRQKGCSWSEPSPHTVLPGKRAMLGISKLTICQSHIAAFKCRALTLGQHGRQALTVHTGMPYGTFATPAPMVHLYHGCWKAQDWVLTWTRKKKGKKSQVRQIRAISATSSKN